MRILLVSPKKTELDESVPGWLRMPQLSLSIIAALTPRGHEVVIAEEEDGPLPVEDQWDVVGITSMTATAPRAYELSLLFRNRGARVVLGGIHPSVLPEEAAQYADAVVVGEAEGLWPQVLFDIKHNRLKKVYRNWQPDISDSPLPVRKKKRSILGFPPVVMPIMFSRGCPNDCEFCCVHRVYGRRQRFIPIESIVKDIAQSGSTKLLFLDDNIGGVRPYALKLFKALEPLRVIWGGQASARLILDDELFRAAVRSGCRALFIGVETIELAARRKLRKSLSTISLYEEAIKRCRESGVLFHGSFIFGLDEESPDVFERTLDFLLRNNVPSIASNILTPYPGTYLFDRLMREGRILHTNWSYYDHGTVSFEPKNMHPEELSEKYLDFTERFYSLSSIRRRAWAQLRVKPLMFLGMNIAFRRVIRVNREHARKYFKWLREEAGRLSTPVVEPPEAMSRKGEYADRERLLLPPVP